MEFLLKNKKWFIIGLSALMAVCVAGAVLVGVLAAGDNLPYKSVIWKISQNEKNYSSLSNISVLGDNVYVSDETQGTVNKVGSSLKFDAGDQVNGVYAYGGNVYALVGGLQGYVVKLEAATLKEVARAETGHTPVDAVMVNGKLYVANRFSNTVTVYDSSLKLVKTIEVKREPMAMAFADGSIYVACHLPAGAANADIVSADVSVISTSSDSVTSNISLLNGTSSVKDICVSSDGGYLYVTNIFSRYAYPTTQLDRGWINSNGITVISLKDGSAIGDKHDIAGVLLDDVKEGAPNPYGITAVNDKILVTLSGFNKLSVVDEKEMLARLTRAFNAGTLDGVPDDFRFLSDAKRKISLDSKASGTRYIAADAAGEYAYIANYFSGTVSKIDLSDFSSMPITVYNNPAADDVREGEIMWYNAIECFEKWESCASCHPDGRVDAFNWDNLNDGLGNAKQTKSMIYSHRTPPVMITGARDSAELAVEKGMMFIQMNNNLDQKQYEQLNAFMRTLKPMPSPYLNRDGSLSDSAKRGKKLFEKNSCTECHYGPNFTDLSFHKSKTLDLDDTWENREFVTPTLVETWRSGPYFFNGSMATMEDAVKYYLPSATDKEITDISNYILSIGAEGEPYGVEQVFFKKGSETVINKLMPNQSMGTVTVRKQSEEVKGNVTVKIAYYDKNDNMLVEGKKAILRNMNEGDLATINLGAFDVPSTMEEGGYYKISIENSKGKKITTDYIVYVKEA